MELTTQTVSDLYTNLNKAFMDGVEEAGPISDPLFKVVPSTSRAEAYSWLSNIPGFREMFRGQSRVLRNVVSIDFSVANRDFEDTIVVPVNDVKDNSLSQYSTIASDLGKAGRLVWDEIVFELFNGGFTTTLAYDGLTWFNDSHAIGIGTIDNKGTAALAEASLEDAIEAMMGYKVQPDKLSKARPLNPASKLTLLVPPALYMAAKKLVTNEFNAAGANNHLYNAAEVMVSSWLTSTTAWFLLNTASGSRPVYLQNREKLSLINKNPSNSDYALMTDNLVYASKIRCAALPSFVHLAYGSTGAA